MNRVSLLKSLSIFLATTVSFSIQAEMYKWVDEDGVTQYTQTPPPGDVQVKTIKPPPKVDTESARKVLEQQEEEAEELREERLTTKEKQQDSQRETAQRRKECEAARSRLASYERPRVNKVLPDGTRIVLPEPERQAELQKSRELVQKACSPN